MEQAVERVVAVMRNRYHERLYLPELAAAEYFSSFHFTRIFRRETGVAPSQYLTAVRLFEAKQLLLSTSLSVADIACQVGYPGIGTFTTRFSKLVGISPGQYRQLPPERMLCIAENVHRLPSLELLPAPPEPISGRRGASITVSVHFGLANPAGPLLVGVFDDPIPQGPPIACTVLRGTRGLPVRFDGLPEGQWYVLAVAPGNQEQPTILFDTTPVPQLRPGSTAAVELALHHPYRTDPPIMAPLCNRLPATQRLVA
jgi:AraC-like DNA-binding protein